MKRFLVLILVLTGLAGGVFWIKAAVLPPHSSPSIKPYQKKTLRVLTYSSFAGVYGPGRAIKKQFESFCECSLQWFLTEDSTSLLQRFLMVPDIDVVIGWDQISLVSLQNNLWEDVSFLKKKLNLSFPKADHKESFFHTPFFLPLDWSPVGFISREQRFYSHLKSLHGIDGQISFPEPRASILGLQFYYWIYESFKADRKQIAGFLKKLKNKIYGPVFSWSLAYGFFQKGKTEISLSYLSSLIYHQKEEPDKKYFFVYVEEGHPYQIEFLSVSKKTKNKKLALQFSEFLLSKKIQNVIRDRHYMFSALKNEKDSTLLNLNPINFISYKELPEFIKNKENLLKLWEKSLR